MWAYTDVDLVDGILPFATVMPLVLGHETAGVVSKVGNGVKEFKLGDRVGISMLGTTQDIGLGRDGGYGEKVVTKVEELLPIPAEVEYIEAAIGIDAVATAHWAVLSNGQVGPGMRVGIIGLGGLGQFGAQIASLSGAEVLAAEINPAIRQRASEFGVTEAVEDVLDLQPFELDVIVDFAGFGTTIAKAIQAVRFGGRVVQVGMGRTEATISTERLIMNEVTLIGSRGSGPQQTILDVYDLFASGKLTSNITKIGFEDIGEALEQLRRGEVSGRLVATYE